MGDHDADVNMSQPIFSPPRPPQNASIVSVPSPPLTPPKAPSRTGSDHGTGYTVTRMRTPRKVGRWVQWVQWRRLVQL